MRGLKQLTSIFKEPSHVSKRQEMDIAHGGTDDFRYRKVAA